MQPVVAEQNFIDGVGAEGVGFAPGSVRGDTRHVAAEHRGHAIRDSWERPGSIAELAGVTHAAKHHVAGPEVAVDANIKAVDIVRRYRICREVAEQPREIRRREKIEQLDGVRVQPARGQNVACERIAHESGSGGCYARDPVGLALGHRSSRRRIENGAAWDGAAQEVRPARAALTRNQVREICKIAGPLAGRRYRH